MTYGLWGDSAPTGIITRAEDGDDADMIELAQQGLDNEPDCEHGLSAWLCAGPMHYPV